MRNIWMRNIKDEKYMDEEPSLLGVQEASVRIRAGADAIYRVEDKWRGCGGEGGREETTRAKKGEPMKTDFDCLEF